MKWYATLSGTLRDCLSGLVSSLEDSVNSRGQGLDIEFVKKEVLYLINICSRLTIKKLKQSLNNSDVSRHLILC